MSKNYLSKDSTTALKGIFALFVLIHHLYQYSGILHGTAIGHIFQTMGYLSVAMFFFLSGYGMMQSYKKSEGYINSYPRKRILTFYIDIIVFVLIYLIFRLITEPSIITVDVLIKSLTFGGTIIANGWYLQVALVLYLLFYLIFRFVKNNNLKVLLAILSTLIFVSLLWLLGFSSTWFEGLLAFPLGLLWSKYQDKIDNKENKAQISIGFISFAIFGMSFVLNYVIKVEVISILLKMLSAVSFVVFVIQMIRWIPIVCKLTLYLGKISLETYTLQGLLLWILHIDQIANMSVLIRLIISVGIFIGTICLAALVNPLIARLNKVVRGE